MRHVREVLRLKWERAASHREVARSLGVSVGVVSATLARAGDAGLSWAEARELSEAALEARLYPSAATSVPMHPAPDCVAIHRERRRKGVTLQLLHLEYLERHPDGYRYTQFCEHYRRWARRQKVSMRQVHRAGEKVFVDYAGQKPHWVDPRTGEIHEAELFVAVLGASNYTYAEASPSQQIPDWVDSHGRALQYFGGVPGAVICDQLKSGVSASCRYEPGVQRTYEECAHHYDTVILPARPATPRDKAKAEVAVQVAERWILARLRDRTFFSIDEQNEAIGELLEDLNGRVMRVYGRSRRELFEAFDRPALRPLPAHPFVYAAWRFARVNIDYHIEVEHHYYSVPHPLMHEQVDARVTSSTVEIFHRGERVASHRRSHERGRHTTDPAHMPRSHRQHLEWSPTRFIAWAGKIGPGTAGLIEAILADRPHPEQGYRSCLGILRLARRYDAGRLEAACTRAFAAGARSYRHVDSILKHGLDHAPALETPASPPPIHHENVRGSEYYQ